MPRSARIALAVSLALCIPSLALADGFAAQACKFLNGATTLNPFLTALNGTNTTQTLLCDANPDDAPLGLDLVGGEVERVLVGNVQVIDNSPTEDVVCRLITLDRNGQTLQSGSVSSSGTGNVNIGDPVVLQLEPAEAAARVVLLCSVPGMVDGQFSGLASLFATSDQD